jgi:hypothetical protein
MSLERKRFVSKPLPESKYYHPIAAPTCPECRQPVHPHKFTKKEKVDAMQANTQDITGFVIITMPDRSQYRVLTEKLYQIHGKVQRSGIAPWHFHKYPILAWLRDSASVESTDGSSVHQLLLDLIRGKQEERKAS